MIKKITILIFLVFISIQAWSQIIPLCPANYNPDDCEQFVAGTTVTFQLEAAPGCVSTCDIGDIVVVNLLDPLDVVVIPYTTDPFEVTFDEGGSFVIECGVAVGAVPMQAICVVANVPTLGEWGIILLTLLLISFGAAAVYQSNASNKGLITTKN